MTSKILPGSVQISVVDWAQSQTVLRQIRKTVFIDQQQVPEDLEWDGLDKTAVHLLAQIPYPTKTDAEPVGTARILINGQTAHIGRMAVMPNWRGKGIGKKILHQAIAECQQRSVKKIILNAQSYVLDFYQQASFVISSAEFMDAGIAHKEMTLILKHD